ncbi:MAG: polysaccharide deacetylase family protein [Pseudomonadota bacterium]
MEQRHQVDIHLDFDDGHQSDHERVLPLLNRASLRAAFFMPTDWIGREGHLGKDQIKDLVQEGMTIGSHGTDHRAWTELSDDELSRQLRHSKRVLEQITGTRVKIASAPYGFWSQRVVSAAIDAGFERLQTCDERPGSPAGFLNHRIVIRNGDDVDAILTRKLSVLRRAVHKAKDLGERILVQAA